MAKNGVFSWRRRPEKIGCVEKESSNSITSQSHEVHVLAVDDSLVDRKVIERLLKITSCKVTAVDSGRRALQFLGLGEEKNTDEFEGLKVDLIITDYCMPGMTGFDLLKKIKGSSAFRDLPVVIMSSENVLARIDRCLEEGAEDFIVKPVKLSDVKRLKETMFGEQMINHSIQQEETTCKRKLHQLTSSLGDLSPSSPSSVPLALTTSSTSSPSQLPLTLAVKTMTPLTLTVSSPLNLSSSLLPSQLSPPLPPPPPQLDLARPYSPTTTLESPTRRIRLSN